MAQGGNSGSPNQALVIFLVFFVLASIALGVTTYLGFDGQKDLITAKTEAQSDAKKKEGDAEWFRFQSMFYRQLLGDKLNDADKQAYNVARDGFDKVFKGGQDPDAKKKEALETMFVHMSNPDVFKAAAVDGNAKDADQRVKGAIKGDFLKPYQEVVKDKIKEKDVVAATLKDKEDALVAANSRADAAEKALAAEKKAHDDTRVAAKGREDALLKDKEAAMKKWQDDLNAIGEKVASLGNDLGAAKEENGKQVLALKQQLLSMKAAVEKYQAESPAAKANIFDFDQPKGKIVDILGNGSQPFINLGSADNLKPGVTFSVYGAGIDGKPIAYPILNRDGKQIIGTDGQPEKEGKATVEVLSVHGPHQSQVRVTSIRDPNRDPIMKGDLLFNPGWDPYKQQHVAIAGFIDMTGSQRDEMSDFVRMLERNRITVDAYLDLREGAIKGKGMTRTTDFLILGDLPDFGGAAKAKEDDPRAVRQQEIIAKMTEMQTQAQANDVMIISLRKFLLVSGFRTGKTSTGGDSPPGSYRP